jgi:hypothetical protein
MLTRLDDLPGFQVDGISAEECNPKLTGTFTHLKGVRRGRSWLYASSASSLIGDLVDLDETSRRATFIAPFWSSDSPIQVGTVAPWVDGYWQPYHVSMILDPDAVWRRTKLCASPAQHFDVGGLHGWGEVGRALPEGAVPTFVQDNGWDHEHCELCWASIGPGGQPYGYVDQDDRWLCEGCYGSYAATRSLGFLVAT